MRYLSLVLVLLMVACAGKPIWYGKGVKWTVPIVSPLEAEPVVVPVMIKGKGPYLFLLDPGALQSGIDGALASKLELYSVGYEQKKREDDTVAKMSRYEALSMQVGDLRLNNPSLYGFPSESLIVRGQKIHGYLGKDLVSESVVIAIDRDRGILTLALAGHQEVPGNARRIAGRVTDFRLRITAKTAAGKSLDMIVDLGAKLTAAWPALLAQFGWALQPGSELVTIDETGHHKTMPGRTKGQTLALGAGVRVDGVQFTNYDNQNYREVHVDGHIGQNVLARYHVVLDRHKSVLFLSQRAGELGTHIQDRITRWGDTFKGCQAAGCAQLALVKAKVEGESAKLVVIVDQVAQKQATEFFLEGLDENHKPVAGPLMRLTVSQGTVQTTVAVPNEGDLAKAASFRVVDITPFPIHCVDRACLATIAR